MVLNFPKRNESHFIGDVSSSYAKGEYYVEGVGKEIKLIKEDSLDVPTTFTTNIVNPFDGASLFDRPTHIWTKHRISCNKRLYPN